MSPSLFLTSNFVCEKFSMHPASQSWPMESKPEVFMLGDKCSEQASGGSEGMLRYRIRVDGIRSPLGRTTVTGEVSIFEFSFFVPA